MLVEFNLGLVIIIGLTANFTPPSLGFLGIVISLTAVGIKTKNFIFPIISTLLVVIVLITSFFTMVIYPVGPVLGTILANEDKVMLVIFLSSAISIPSIITLFGFVKSRKTTVQ